MRRVGEFTPEQLIAAVACLVFSASALGDPIHAIGGGAYQHHDSRWIFPREVAGFTLVGTPQDVDGTSDAVAYYAIVTNGQRTTAAVDVYSPDSAAPEATLAATRSAIETKHSAAATKSDESFSARRQPALLGTKIVFTDGANSNSAQTNLYFIDTGTWIVKIRITTEHSATNFAMSDEFVRQQRWDSFGDTA